MLNAKTINIMMQKPEFYDEYQEACREVFRVGTYKKFMPVLINNPFISRQELIKKSGLGKATCDCIIRMLVRRGLLEKKYEQRGRTGIIRYKLK